MGPCTQSNSYITWTDPKVLDWVPLARWPYVIPDVVQVACPEMAEDSVLVPQRSKQARLIVLSLPIDGEAPIVLSAMEAIPLFERDEVPSDTTLQELLP